MLCYYAVLHADAAFSGVAHKTLCVMVNLLYCATLAFLLSF